MGVNLISVILGITWRYHKQVSEANQYHIIINMSQSIKMAANYYTYFCEGSYASNKWLKASN